MIVEKKKLLGCAWYEPTLVHRISYVPVAILYIFMLEAFGELSIHTFYPISNLILMLRTSHKE